MSLSPRVLISLLLCLLASASAAATARGQDAALFDELTVIFPDTPAEEGSSRLRSDTPLNVPVGVHLLVTGLEGDAEVTLTFPSLAQTRLRPDIYELLPVPVEQNTGLSSRTEAWDGKDNPYVVRKAPFEVYEVLRPADAVLRANENGVLAARVELFADQRLVDRLTSDYIDIHIASGEWSEKLTWMLYVHPVAVPLPGVDSPGYTNWFSPSIVAERHGLELWSDPFWSMLGKYADLMLRGRQNTFWIRWGDFMSLDAESRPSLDRERLERYVSLFLARGFTHIEGGHLAGRHKGDWSSPRLDLMLTGSDVTSEAGRAELATMLHEINAALAELRLPERVVYLQHLSDEPTATNAESYKELAAQVRKQMPGVAIFDATMCTELVDAVDHWCPQVQVYEQHRNFFEKRQQAGDQVWVYTCLIPGGRHLNRLLDQERVRQVYLGWSLVKYDLYGFLHWGFNHYRSGQDPFETSVVPHGAGPPNFLPAGDTHVVYPGIDRPWSGQRFEAHRIGLEDSELLRELKERDPAAAARIIGAVLRASDDYEMDLTAYRAAKLRLLEEAVTGRSDGVKEEG